MQAFGLPVLCRMCPLESKLSVVHICHNTKSHFVSPCKTTSGDKHKKHRKSIPCGIQIKQCVTILQYLSLTIYTNLVAILFYRLQMISFVFYVYRPLTSKMPKALPVYWRISERELVLVKKSDNTLVSPRNEGFTCLRVFYWFSSKSIFATSDNKYYHSKYRMSLKKIIINPTFRTLFHEAPILLVFRPSIAFRGAKHCFSPRKALLCSKRSVAWLL